MLSEGEIHGHIYYGKLLVKKILFPKKCDFWEWVAGVAVVYSHTRPSPGFPGWLL